MSDGSGSDPDIDNKPKGGKRGRGGKKPLIPKKVPSAQSSLISEDSQADKYAATLPYGFLAIAYGTIFYGLAIVKDAFTRKNEAFYFMLFTAFSLVVCAIIECLRKKAYNFTFLMMYGQFFFVLSFSMKMEESTEELMCSKAVGGIFCLWFIFDVLYFVISFKKGITYLIFFAMHFIFTVLAASSYWSESEDRDVATPAGVLGCLSGAVAFYIALGMLLNNIYKITVIPIGLWKNEREDTKIE